MPAMNLELNHLMTRITINRLRYSTRLDSRNRPSIAGVRADSQLFLIVAIGGVGGQSLIRFGQGWEKPPT
jgi:hypothetical protein